MPDFHLMRENMVKCQVIPANVTHPELIKALLTVPREKFVPRQFARIAYMDAPLMLGSGRALLKPTAFARLFEAATLLPGDAILYIGEGVGYGPALLGRMGLSVTVIVRKEEETTLTLEGLNMASVAIVTGNPLKGWVKGGAYDKIFLEGCIEFLPQTLTEQLKEGGEVLCFLSCKRGGCHAVKYVKKGETLTFSPLFDAWAPSLKDFLQQKSFVF